MIIAKDIKKKYNDQEVLRGIDLKIDKKDGGHSLDKMGQMEYDRQHIRYQR